jgi:hypothetical protein
MVDSLIILIKKKSVEINNRLSKLYKLAFIAFEQSA